MEETISTPVSLADLFARRQTVPVKRKVTSERAELIRYFHENVNKGRGGKFPPVPASRVGMMLSHLSMHDLYAFKSMCEDRARNGYPWSKFFWGSLKAKETSGWKPPQHSAYSVA